MEIQFQQQPKGKIGKFKGRNNNNNNNTNKFVGVRQRPSGRWVAEIKDTTQKIRMWLGTFETAEAAARAYDEAACLLRGSNTRTNFVTHRVCTNSLLASRIQNLLNNKKRSEKIQKTISATTNSSTSSRKTVTRTSTRSTGGFTSSREDIGMVTNSSSRETVANTTTSRETIASTTSSGETVATSSSSREIAESSTTSSRSSSDFDSCGKAYDQTQLFDDAYKPDLSNCIDEFDMNPYNTTWGFGNNSGIDRFPLAQEMLELPENVNLMSETSSSVDREFEWMKVERQISASLYAMNGVQEYMETVHDPNYEAIWDIPSYFARF